MKVLISPTKQMDFASDITCPLRSTQPLFQNEARRLNTVLRELTPAALASLMKLNPELAADTYQRIHAFGNKNNKHRPALFAYSGTVFREIGAASLNARELEHAKNHLRILSGLYGILKPFDIIEPYRLEMKTSVYAPVSPGGKSGSLRTFWKSKVTETLVNEPLIINLASTEYSQLIDKKKLHGQVLNFHFKENHNGILKTVGMYSKQARGLMVRRILEEQVVNPRTLQSGTTGGYRYDSKLSNDVDWFFVRG